MQAFKLMSHPTNGNKEAWIIPKGTFKEAALVLLLLAFTYAYFYHDPGWNGNSRLGLTFAIVDEGQLTIDSFHVQERTFTKDKAIFNGHYYTTKAIGSSLVAAIFYYPLHSLEKLQNIKLNSGLVKYLLTFCSIGLPSALAGSLMYVLCKQVSGNIFRSYVFTMSINLGTLIFPFSVIFFGHQLAGSLLFGAFFLIYQTKLDTKFSGKASSFMIGFLLGLALITEYPVAPIVLILTLYYFYVLYRNGSGDRSRVLVLAALGASIPVAVAMAYNTAVFGNPISTGYSYSAVSFFQQHQTQGLVGIGWPNPQAVYFMTLHPAYGLFWQSPVLIMSLVGLGFMSRTPHFRFEAMISVTAFFSLLILYSGFYNWWGGSTFGPRYLTPMLTFMCLPLAFVPKRWFPGIVLTGLVSIVQMFIAVYSLILVTDTVSERINEIAYFEFSTIYSVCLQLLRDGVYAKNIGNQLFGLTSWISLVPLILVLFSVTLLFYVKQVDNSLRTLPA